ncbi:MAG: S9 family peptidase, partial [Candidatus Latescibacterota bacterium]
RIAVDDYTFSEDGTKVLLYTDSEKVWRQNTKGYYYVYDIPAGTLTPLSERELGFQWFAKLDPSGTKAAFVRQRNIYLVDLETGDERRLTRDGSPGGVINGTSDWVYEEEFGLRNAWHWSPDGKYIAFLQLDETRTRDYWLADLRGQYPEFKRFRYPKAGEANSEIRPGVIDIETGSITYFETDTWYAGGDEHEYLPSIGWTPEIEGAAQVWVFRLNRDQNHLDLIYGDPATGSTEIVLTESEPTYIDVETGFSDLDVGKLTYLEDGEHFVWISEADGFKHLYLHRNTGERIAQLTSGDWMVTDFEGVDEDSGLVYFTATIESPTERHLYRIPFEPGASPDVEPEKITMGAGWHSSNLSADRSYFIDTFSNLTTPTIVTLRRTDGTEVKVLEDNADLRSLLAEYDLPDIELIDLYGADSTRLNAYVVKPRSFDPFKSYPLLFYIYGGPGSQRVRNAWQGSRGLWHQYLADTDGIVIVCVDPRGTGGRGKAFQNVSYKQLGLHEAEDFIAVAQRLGDRDYIDASRIGIWGWSYGGFMTLNSMFMDGGPETFKLGVAVAPVVNWRQYDTIYTERYMSTPQKNEEGYRVGSPINYVDRMADRQELLLIHGTGDDNVHFQNSIQLVDALQKAGKQFRFMAYPGKTHSISGNDTQYHLFTMITDFIGENL